MFARKLMVAITTAMIALAMALCGCSALEDVNAQRRAAAESFGTPELPVMQGLLDLSPARAVAILDNFVYREHEGVGQWANSEAMFAVLDGSSQATLDKEISTGEAGWVLLLYAADGSTWRSCTIEDLKGGANPDKATLVVFPRKGASFDTVDRAIEFIDALFLTRMGAVAIDAGASPGRIVFAVAKNPTGAVYQIVEENPGRFALDVYPSSHWIDGSYDQLVAECGKHANAPGCAYREFEVTR